MITGSQREDLYSRSNGDFIIVKNNHQVRHFPNHWHQYGEIMCVEDGNVTVTVNGTPYTLQKDTILLISPCELHSVEPGEQQPRTDLIQFDMTLLYRSPSVMLHLQKYCPRKYLIEKSVVPELYAQLHRMISEILKMERNRGVGQDSFCDVHQYLLLCQMILLLFEQEHSLAGPEEKQPSEISRSTIQSLQKVCEFIDQNFANEITQGQMADLAGMSTSYFSKVFKQYTGVLFPAYLSRCRLSNAKRLLADKTMKITDIAFSSGFGSLASFNRVFSTFEGMSPTEFRHLYNNS